jgi:hypothetical protein
MNIRMRAEKKFGKSSGAYKSVKILNALFKKQLRITKHFAIRLYQRFTIEERRIIIRTLYELALSKFRVFACDPDSSDRRVVLCNNAVAPVTLENATLCVISIWKLKPNSHVLARV